MTVEYQDFLFTIVQAQIAEAHFEQVNAFGKADHVLVEQAQPLVLQALVVPQAPLAAAVVEAPAVALPGKVDPFWVAEFVAHEVQVGLAAAGQGKEANHLVQGNGPVDDGVVGCLFHVRIHGRICQAEDQRLVANQCLVVALHIGHGVFTRAAHTHAAPHLEDVPVLIPPVPHSAHPHIGQAHAQPVVKADAAVCNGQTHAGHTGHILGNGHRHGVHLTNQLVCQLQIGDGLGVGIVGEVLVIGIEVRAQAVVMVEHGGHAVEAEAVEMVFGHPEFQVAQQEVDDAGLSVVEALGAPGGVVALGAVVEELPGGAVEHIDALGGVLHGVGVDHVQQHAQPHFVGLVYQVFQVLGLAEPAGGGIEVRHLIAEAAIVGVLHNGHELDGVVARFLHSGQHQVRKLPISANLALLLGHAHVGLVNIEGILPAEALIRPRKGFLVVRHLAQPVDGAIFLDHPAGIERDVPGALHKSIHHGLHLAALPQGVVPGQVELPVAVAKVFQGMGRGVPVVKFAGEVELVGAGSPLPIVPAPGHMVEAEVFVGIGEFTEGLPLGKNSVLGVLIQTHPQIDVSGEVLELGIQFQNTIHDL